MDERWRGFLMEGEMVGARYVLTGARNQALGKSGVRLGSGVGSSLEFLDHRQYHPGDDVRHIDWNAFARSDRLTLKLFREEIAPHLDLVVDGSRSMDLADTGKGQATVALASVLAQAAENAGFSHTLWWLTETGCHRVANGNERPSRWDGFHFSSPISPAESVSRLPPAWRPFGMRIFMSDLLWEGDPLSFLKHLADRASQLVVIQVLADIDSTGPKPGNLQLIDSENGEAMNLHLDEASRNQYLKSLVLHQENWQNAAKYLGTFLTTVVAEKLLADWRLDDLVVAGLLQVTA